MIRYTVERDGRWLAEVEDVPGARAHGPTMEEAGRAALKLANEKLVADRGELIKRCMTLQES